MNRKDLIIVAVLMNVGLLVTLFLTALKRESPEPLLQTAQMIHEQKETVSLPPLSKECRLEAKEGDQKPPEEKIEDKKETPAALSPVPFSIKKEAQSSSFPSSKTPFRIVAVEKGDVLEKIARNYGVSVSEIMKLNHLTDSRLQIGQELKVPQKLNHSKEKRQEETGVYYIVKGGDSPWTIAQKHHIQVEELLKLNHMDEEKAKRLRPGDRLRIK